MPAPQIPLRALDQDPYQQCHWTPQSGNPPPYPCGRGFSRRQFGADAGVCTPASCGRNTVRQQEIHEYKAFRGGNGRRFYRWLTSFLQRLQTNLRIILDTTPCPCLFAQSIVRYPYARASQNEHDKKICPLIFIRGHSQFNFAFINWLCGQFLLNIRYPIITWNQR